MMSYVRTSKSNADPEAAIADPSSDADLFLDPA